MKNIFLRKHFMFFSILTATLFFFTACLFMTTEESEPDKSQSGNSDNNPGTPADPTYEIIDIHPDVGIGFRLSKVPTDTNEIYVAIYSDSSKKKLIGGICNFSAIQTVECPYLNAKTSYYVEVQFKHKYDAIANLPKTLLAWTFYNPTTKDGLGEVPDLTANADDIFAFDGTEYSISWVSNPSVPTTHEKGFLNVSAYFGDWSWCGETKIGTYNRTPSQSPDAIQLQEANFDQLENAKEQNKIKINLQYRISLSAGAFEKEICEKEIPFNYQKMLAATRWFTYDETTSILTINDTKLPSIESYQKFIIRVVEDHKQDELVDAAIIDYDPSNQTYDLKDYALLNDKGAGIKRYIHFDIVNEMANGELMPFKESCNPGRNTHYNINTGLAYIDISTDGKLTLKNSENLLANLAGLSGYKLTISIYTLNNGADKRFRHDDNCRKHIGMIQIDSGDGSTKDGTYIVKDGDLNAQLPANGISPYSPGVETDLSGKQVFGYAGYYNNTSKIWKEISQIPITTIN